MLALAGVAMRRTAIWILSYLFVILLGAGLRWRIETTLAMLILSTICMLLLPTIQPWIKTERMEKEETGKEEIGTEEPHSHCWHVLAYGPKHQITNMFCCWCDTHVKASPSNFHHNLIPVKPRYEEEA